MGIKEFAGSLGAAALIAGALAAPATATTVTVAPATGSGGNCYPFGGALGLWPAYAGFVYKDIPAFSLPAGGTLAFDTHAVNDTDVQLDIALAPSVANGSDEPAGAFTQVVANTETATSPRGDSTVGDYDLEFTTQAPFDFPGGGLIIRFSNPGGAFAADGSCTGNLEGADSTDASGFFVGRFFNDADGSYPWDDGDPYNVGAFQIAGAGPYVPPRGPTPPTGAGDRTPAPAARDTVAPVITDAKLWDGTFAVNPKAKASAVERGAKLRFSLSEPATVVFVTEQRVGGRWRKIRIFGQRFGAGKNSLDYSGRIKPRGKQRALRPGRYRIRMRPSDRAGNHGTVTNDGFRIANAVAAGIKHP